MLSFINLEALKSAMILHFYLKVCTHFFSYGSIVLHFFLQAKLIIHIAYGSQRHLAGFRELGLQSDQIYIHGSKRASRSSSSASCQVRGSVGVPVLCVGAECLLTVICKGVLKACMT